jgi:hypothetical protein
LLWRVERFKRNVKGENESGKHPDMHFHDLRHSSASLISLEQIVFRHGGKLIALALTAKKRFLPVGLES